VKNTLDLSHKPTKSKLEASERPIKK